MAITKLKHHDKCEVLIQVNTKKLTHYASLRCKDCDTHIQWLNRQEAHQIRLMGVKMTRELDKELAQ